MLSNTNLAFAIVNIFYLISHLASNWRDAFGYSLWLRVAIFGGLNFFCRGMILSSIRSGLTYELYFDFLCINLLVQFGTSFSGYFWYIYLVIPGYFIYQGVRRLLDWVFTPDPEEADDEVNYAGMSRKERRKEERRRAKLSKQ